MSSSNIERKLAAIMFTDIAGYTEQMSKDENKALEMLRKKRSIIKPLIDNHKGIYVKEIGDGTLSYFESGYNASACAKELQKKLQNDELNIKVGIHIGDIVFDDEDVYGDGVNIASRIESLAPAGGVLISKNVYDELINKDNFDGIALGLQSLKGVGRLVELYAIKDDYLVVPKLEDYKETEIEVHKDDEVPSIAIIPFDNKGADEDIFYAYGISIDLISDVTSAGLIRVASKKQIDEAGELPQDELAKKLDVRYMANGELWRMGDMFQLSVELYDTKDKKVVWSDRWQENWDNLPTIKSSLTDGFLKALDTKTKLEKKNEIINPKAYELYLQAQNIYYKRKNADDTKIARSLIRDSLQIDSNLISAIILHGDTYWETNNWDNVLKIYYQAFEKSKKLKNRLWHGRSLRKIGIIYALKGENKKSYEYCNKALEIAQELDDKDGVSACFGNLGNHFFSIFDYNKALEYYNKSLEIKEQLMNKDGISKIVGNIGNIYMNKCDYDRALEYYNKSLEIKEKLGDNYSIPFALTSVGNILRLRGDYIQALEKYKSSIILSKHFNISLTSTPLGLMGITYYNIGDFKNAKKYIEESIEISKKQKLERNQIHSIIYLFLIYKNFSKDYNLDEIYKVIKKTKEIRFETNYQLFNLLEDKSYLESAYNQVQEKASAMKEELKAKFLSYPIPKAIVEEWEKVTP